MGFDDDYHFCFYFLTIIRQPISFSAKTTATSETFGSSSVSFENFFQSAYQQ